MDNNLSHTLAISTNHLPIGVFDSGVGGLTVLKALQQQLPNEQFLYLGDTARVPYGIKSRDTVIRYAKQASEILLQRGIKLLVIACNTATTLALEALQENSSIPVIGVVEPGATAACKESKSGRIAVIATEATVNSQGYQQAIKRLRPQAEVWARSCGLFVSLAEEGFVDGPIVKSVVQHYLQSFMADNNADCLVLGCTHFPVLATTIQAVIGDHISVIDSAKTTAEKVAESIQHNTNLTPANNTQDKTVFLVTDAPARFARVARYFLGKELSLEQVELVDILKTWGVL